MSVSKINFILSSFICLGYSIIGYWYIWPKLTILYEEIFHFSSIIFGILHGFAESLLFLSIYATMEIT